MQTLLTPVSKKRARVDLFVAGCFENGKIAPELNSLAPDFANRVKLGFQRKRFNGKKGETFSSYDDTFTEAPEIFVIGLGDHKKYGSRSLRKITGKIVGLAKTRKAKKVRILLESFVGPSVKLPEAAEILTEISLLASYEFAKYKSKKEDDEKKNLDSLELLFSKRQFEAALRKKVERARIVGEGVICARDLGNEPGNVMNPVKLADSAREVARRKKISCQVLGQKELEKLKMGGILGVNQGSKTPPALIAMEYGERFKRKGTVCLVGKGVTFDMGGVSVKFKELEKMKYDMCGAAAVIATMGVVADLRLPVHVVGLSAAVENMVAENPQRPGDIIRMYNGKTVEVLNTDAEGRLIVGDALAYTEKYKPKAIVDIATLTGACMKTFSDKAIGLMGNQEGLLAKIKRSGQETGERCWALPLWDEYGEEMKGHHSDLYNIGGPNAGTITGAMFLKEFVPGKTPWAHLDIAGTAWCDKPRYDGPKGATGVGVRLLANFLSNWR